MLHSFLTWFHISIYFMSLFPIGGAWLRTVPYSRVLVPTVLPGCPVSPPAYVRVHVASCWEELFLTGDAPPVLALSLATQWQTGRNLCAFASCLTGGITA